MKKIILLNGVIEAFSLHESLLNNRAFRYGDGLFETIRVCNGKPLFAELHYKRLTEGLSMLKIRSKEADSFEFFINNLYCVIEKNNISEGGRIRYNIFRNSGGFYKPMTNEGISLVEGESIENNLYELNEQGILVNIFEDILKPINILSPYKNTNALIHVMAGLKNQDINYESVLLNEQKNICEGVSSNIFIFKNNILYTPALNQGCVKGIMRLIIIENLSKALNIKVVETNLKQDLLHTAEEVFLTNVIQGVKWILGYEKKRYYNSLSKKLIFILNDFISNNY